MPSGSKVLKVRKLTNADKVTQSYMASNKLPTKPPPLTLQNSKCI